MIIFVISFYPRILVIFRIFMIIFVISFYPGILVIFRMFVIIFAISFYLGILGILCRSICSLTKDVCVFDCRCVCIHESRSGCGCVNVCVPCFLFVCDCLNVWICFHLIFLLVCLEVCECVWEVCWIECVWFQVSECQGLFVCGLASV